jgi:cyclopropane fatty-acyl-phospholipid synthase-like methyltransferase
MENKIFDSRQAAQYYDDANVAEFYESCWGGDDIHIGLYATGEETVREASAAMTRHLLDQAGIGADARVLDVACGFGGTLRQLTDRGARASGIDISEHCVQQARKANEKAGLDNRIDVSVGDFHAIDSAPGTWDAVICQEAIIHSPDRPRVFAEAHRVLRPGGVFAVTDIVTGRDADISLVEAAFARIGAGVGATVDDYRRMAEAAGFDILHVEERPNDIRTHYDKLGERLRQPLVGLDSQARARIAQSIGRWQAALENEDISWACIVARKPG